MQITNEDLQLEYAQWLRSIAILNTLNNDFFVGKEEKSRIKSALENALMTIMLYKDYERKDVFELLNTEAVYEGFQCIGWNSFQQDDAEHVYQFIQRYIPIHQYFDIIKTNGLQLSITKERFKFNQFELKRNQYVDKAYAVLEETYTSENAARHLLRSSMRYASIYSETRHIGPPQKVYDHFYNWGIRNEGFASPFNARLLGKEDTQFYSLFKDTDAVLGSGGSFFLLDEPDNPGHWCLDPPFIDETMEKVDSIIGHWRTEYPDRSILYIVPAHHEPAIEPDETVTLKAKEHHYEGLTGTLNPLPVDVNIHRYGKLEGFSPEAIAEGYLPGN